MSTRRAVRPAIIDLVRSRMIVEARVLPWLLDGRVDCPTRGRQPIVVDGLQIAKKVSVQVADAVCGMVADGSVRVVVRRGYGACLLPGPTFNSAGER